MSEILQAPFPWFGGKSRCAPEVWARFGEVRNYVEPFFGSGALLLGRPEGLRGGIETINDLDGYVANFWRALTLRPEETASFADNPVNENDLHARHTWLVSKHGNIADRLNADPDFCDPRVAGYWVWGLSCWIGSGWCSGKGPWQASGGRFVKGDAGSGVNKQLPHLGDDGKGVNKKRPHLSNAGSGVNKQRPHLSDAGSGVNKKRPHLSNDGMGVNRNKDIYAWFSALHDRLRDVRVCCGDWTRVLGPSVTVHNGLTGVFLDPPYADTAKRTKDLYTQDSLSVAHKVRRWAIANGDNDKLRICLAGYEGEHQMPSSWECVPWKAKGGYASSQAGKSDNAYKERLWFSPSCLKVKGV